MSYSAPQTYIQPAPVVTETITAPAVAETIVGGGITEGFVGGQAFVQPAVTEVIAPAAPVYSSVSYSAPQNLIQPAQVVTETITAPAVAETIYAAPQTYIQPAPVVTETIAAPVVTETITGGGILGGDVAIGGQVFSQYSQPQPYVQETIVTENVQTYAAPTAWTQPAIVAPTVTE